MSEPKPIKPVQLTDESDSDCTCGCGEAAYPFTTEGLEGYVDTAPGCAVEALREALAEQAVDQALAAKSNPQ